MEPNETMVENVADAAADDALPEGIHEEVDTSMEIGGEELPESEPAEEPQKTQPQGTSEPGWFRKRWDSEVGKLTARIRDEVRGEYEQQFAPLRERLVEMDAKELVASGKVKDLETARELVRYRNGQGGLPAPEPAQARDENGRFVSRNDQQDDPVVAERIRELRHQADSIKAATGLDVIEEWRNNEEIKKAVIKGEMNFYDVADYMKKNARAKKPPAPTRSPNGASGSEKTSIGNMSKEAFARFDQRISEGARYSIK